MELWGLLMSGGFETEKVLAASAAEPMRMGGLWLEAIKTGPLYPGGVEYNANTGKFLLSSFRQGVIYEVGQDGNYRVLVRDERLITGMGIKVDEKRNKLFVVNSDLGISVRHHAKGARMLASLGVYDLSSGEALDFIDLGSLRPGGEKHIANDLAVDIEGNVYITDSLAPIIYKVDSQGRASVFLENKERFAGEGSNLTGIAYQPDGYLIVAKKNEGVLFKVPVANPDKFSEISAPCKFTGADGLVLVNDKDLIVITNRASGVLSDTVFALKGKDDWRSAQVVGKYKFTDDEYPTTGVVQDGKIYVVHGKINRLMTAQREEKETGYVQEATIQQVGTMMR